MDRRIHVTFWVLLLLAVAGGIIWWTAGGKTNRDERRQTATQPVKPRVDPASKAETEAGAVNAVTNQAVTGDAAASPPDPARYRRAYLLALDGGRLKLENAQDIEGDFAPRRGTRKEEEWAGMLRCRLISAAGKVLAEEVIPAPDQLCTVLDAHLGTPKPVSYVVPGPVVFQLRLPRLAEAARLDVARITDSGALKRDLPVGSISLISP